MKRFILLIGVSLLLLTGCAIDTSTTKYVKGNTFVSERMPSVEIQVSSGFTLADSGGIEKNLIADTGEEEFFGLKKFTALYFHESERSVNLFIETEYTMERRWYLLSADFNMLPEVKISISEQNISGKRFDTAITQIVIDGDIFLTKRYSALYGSQSRLSVMVFKRLDKRLFDSLPYSEEAEAILSQFNELADNSFTIVK